MLLHHDRHDPPLMIKSVSCGVTPIVALLIVSVGSPVFQDR